jgi:activator of HSP90 ATPase
VKDAPPVMCDDEEAVENAEGQRVYSEEVLSSNDFAVIGKECGPPSGVFIETDKRNKRQMMNDRKILETLANGPTRRQATTSVAIALGGLALGSTKAWAETEDGISRTAESIHQEPAFTASRKRIYDALTDAKQFDKIIQLSGVMQAMHLPDKPADISGEVGGAFALFGGYITGRHVELVPNERIVQAWRTGGWAPGVYSIARFEFVEQGSGAKIIFDHTGFSQREAEVLASGWEAHYWESLEKLLA